MRTAESSCLLEQLRIRKGACVAVIGAGGKTTTMQRLAEAASAQGWQILLTTTTKIRQVSGVPLILGSEFDAVEPKLRESFTGSPIVVLGRSLNLDDKVVGIPTRLVEQVRTSQIADLVVVEADGAAGRPLKAHGSHEPVIPSGTTLLLVVAGMDALGRPLTADIVHRLPPAQDITGLETGKNIRDVHVARLLLAAGRLAPHGMQVVYILNKADTDARRSGASGVARVIRHELPAAAVIACAHGCPVTLPVWPVG